MKMKTFKGLMEIISKDASAGEYIHDFVHSDNPKFAGKSKEQRKKQALAAYYAQKNEEVVDEGFKAKVAGVVGGVVGLGGLGAGAYHLDKQTPHANINGEKISIAPKNVGHTPPNAKIMTDKDGTKYQVYHHRTSVNRPGHTFATPVDEGFERSSSEFLKKHKDEMEKINKTKKQNEKEWT